LYLGCGVSPAGRLGRWGVLPTRTSHLDPDVPVSVHPAPDILSLRFCSCVDNRGMIRVLLLDSFVSNYYDCYLRDVDELSLLL